jgi:Xaa-Pro aminopeptidase
VQAVTVPGTFPLGAAERLRRGGVKLRVGADPLFPRRAVKRADELGRIRQAQQAAVIAMREAIERIRRAEPGRDGVLELEGATLTSERLRRGIHQRLLDLDCQARDTIVAGGPASADPHETGSGPLRAGEPVVLDIFPQHLDHGYWGDLTRTVVRGRAAPRLRRMYAAVKAAQAAALAAVRPGVCCATVHRAASRELDRRGFGSHIEDGRAVGFIHSTGHGVGLAIHEPPAVSLNRTRLRSGHVITVEPGLYYPDIGGIRIEDTIVVQPGGWQYLVPCEKRFEL